MCVFCLPAVALAHLNDYKNACKSYEQALTLDRYTYITPLDLHNHYVTNPYNLPSRDSPLIHLNYSDSLPGSHFTSNLAQLSLSLFDTHSPRQPSVSPASPAFSAPESYFTMHVHVSRSELSRLPRKTVDRRTDGHTDTHTHTHTHTQTDCNNPPLRMRAVRVNDREGG